MAFELLLDGQNTTKPHGANVFALNKTFDELRQSLKNEDGFKRIITISDIDNLIGMGKLSDVELCGKIDTPEEVILFMNGRATTPVAMDISQIIRIKYVSPHTYTASIILWTDDSYTNSLHFTKEHPIQGTFSFNVKGELLISWLEGVEDDANSIRYLNTVDLPFPVDATNKPINPDDVAFLNSNKPLSLPDVNLEGVADSGGALFNGVYTVFVAYTDEVGNRTNYISALNPITIYYESSGNIYEDIYDAPLDTLTGKVIRLKITNLSTLYNKIDLGVIFRTNSSNLAYSKIVNYSGDTAYVTITNTIQMTKISVSQIVNNYIIYNKGNAISKFENELLIGNVTTNTRDVEFQLMANAITVTYETVGVNSYIDVTPAQGITNTYKDNELIVNHRTFQPNEVYALYIRPIYLDGSRGESYHIPGRVARSASYFIDSGKFADETATIKTGGGALPGNVDPSVYTHFEQAELMGSNVKLFQIRSTADKTIAAGSTGLLAYWENANELYPNDSTFGSLAGQPVRHHKMPDFNNYWDLATDGIASYKQVRLQLKLSNINFGSLIDKISGYEILISTRDGMNNTVIDEALINNTIDYVDGGGNVEVPVTDAGGPKCKFTGFPTTLAYGAIRSFGAYRFNMIAPTVMKYSNPLTVSYLKVENVIEVDKDLTDQSNSYQRTSDLSHGSYFMSKPIDNTLTYLTNSSDIGTNLALSKNDIFKVEEIFNCRTDGLYYESGGREVNYEASIDGIYCRLNAQYRFLNQAMFTDSDAPINTSTNAFNSPSQKLVYGKVLLMQYKEDVYLNFNNQLTATVLQVVGTQNTCTTSGDSYLSTVAIRTVSYQAKSVSLLPYCSATNFELRTPGEGAAQFDGSDIQPTEDNYFNVGFRAKEDLDKNWYNVTLTDSYTSYKWKWIDIYSNTANYWGEGARSIKIDWAKLNNYKEGFIFTPENTFLSKFPFRVAKSLPMASESLFDAWRIFTDNSYQELDNSKGAIQTLDMVDRVLYVRQQFALFAYQVKDSLEAISQSISLESNDIFHNRPEQVISDSLGYIGSNSRFNSLVTPYGYFVIDVKRKNIFKVVGTQAEDIGIGIKKHLQKHVIVEHTNPYDEGDYIFGYNDEDKLVMFTCNIPNSKHDFTLGYDIYNKTFISFHSYVPTMYAATIYNTISLVTPRTIVVLNNLESSSFGVYTHNFKYTKCLFYYDTTNNRSPKQDILDTLQNMLNVKGKQVGSGANKILNFVSWNTTNSVYDEITDEHVFNPMKTIDAIAVYSDTQCTEIKEVKTDEQDWYETEFSRNVENIWSFNNILDAVLDVNVPIISSYFELNLSNLNLKDYWDMSNFIGTFVVVRLIHNNNYIGATTQQYEQIINYIETDFTINNR